MLYLATRRLSRSTRLAKTHVQNALEKLAAALYRPMNERLVKVAADVPDRPDAARREAILEELIRGWAEQIKVRIRYKGLKASKVTNHTICPYLIEPSPWSDSVYVIAKTNVWDDITPFQLERIEKAVLTTEQFEVDSRFEEEGLFKYAWGIWTGDQSPETVRLRFTGREAVRRVQESVWHPGQTISEPDEQGHVVWEAPIAEWREMLPWVRGWGADVEVLEPENLREALEKATADLTKLYQTSTPTAKLLYQLPYAKTNPDNRDEVHLLLYHLIDVGQVAMAMWQDVLTDSIRQRLAQMLNLNVDEAGRFIAFLAALHDLGKCGPAYQKKYAPPWLKKELKKARLGFDGIGKAYEKTFPHGTVSTWSLIEILPEMTKLDKNFARKIAVAIGGHHGSWPAPGAEDGINDSKYPLWAEVRRDLVWEVQAAFRPPLAVSPPADKTQLNTFLTVLSGLVSVADWLGSRNKECFGFIERPMSTRQYAARSAQIARTSLQELGWVGWQPAGQTVSFSEAFAYLNFKESHRVQTQVIAAAQNLKPPVLLIMEAPTGIGKTEAAVYLADTWLQQHRGRGLYVAMPTQATCNQMYGRIGDFLNNRYPDMRVNYHLVHGQAAWLDELKRTVAPAKASATMARPACWPKAGLPRRKRTLLAPFGVGTVDQTLMSILQTRHFFVRLFGLSHKVVIFDEVHAYDTFMNTLFDRLLVWLSAIGTSVIILSATLPAETRRAVGGKVCRAEIAGYARFLPLSHHCLAKPHP